MKRIPGIITAIMLTGVAQAFATDTTTAGLERKLEFKRYDSSYFERNDTGLTTQTSYLVFTSRPQFEKIFGLAPTMVQNHFLPNNTFDTKIVVAAIARGHFLRKYVEPKVTAARGMIYVWYKIKDAQQNSATFASLLILAVDKGQYSGVVFMEDGKRVGAAAFPRTN